MIGLSNGKTPKSFSAKCKCPRNKQTKVRECGWFSSKMGGLVAQDVVNSITCQAKGTTTQGPATTQAPTPASTTQAPPPATTTQAPPPVTTTQAMVKSFFITQS